MNQIADRDQHAHDDDQQQRQHQTAINVEVALGHDHPDIAAERCPEDDVNEVDPAVELFTLVVKAELHHHFSGRAVKPARSSIARPAFSTDCSSSSLPMR